MHSVLADVLLHRWTRDMVSIIVAVTASAMISGQLITTKCALVSAFLIGND